MLVILRWLGFGIYMYWADNKQHKCPHIHVDDAGNESIYSLDGTLLGGSPTRKVGKFAPSWIARNELTLIKMWNAAILADGAEFELAKKELVK